MLARQVSSLVFFASIVGFNLPADGNPLGLNESDLAFCSAVRDQKVRQVISQSSSSRSSEGGLSAVIKAVPVGANFNSNRSISNSLSDTSLSEYQSKNCDKLLESASKVTVAQIEANAKSAIAQIQAEQDQYAEDIKKEIALIDLAAIENTNAANVQMTRDTNATNLAIAQDDNRTNENIAGINANAQNTQTLMQAVGNTLGTVIASSGQTRQQKLAAEVEKQRIAAEIEKAKIVAETERQRIAANASIATEVEKQKIAANTEISVADRLLAEWGWTKVACYSGAVFIVSHLNI